MDVITNFQFNRQLKVRKEDKKAIEYLLTRVYVKDLRNYLMKVVKLMDAGIIKDL